MSVFSPLRRCLRTPKSVRYFTSPSLQLPWIKVYNPDFKHPGFFVDTQVKTSDLCDGHGRFALEFIPKDIEMARIPLVYVNDIQESNLDISDDMCIMFENKRQLEYLIDLYCTEANVSREVVIAGFGHFIGCRDENFCHLYSNSLCLNHMPPAECNSETTYYDYNTVSDGESVHVTLRSLRDIEVGEEIFNDYALFVFPQWFTDWCAGHQITDARTWLDSEYLKEI